HDTENAQRCRPVCAPTHVCKRHFLAEVPGHDISHNGCFLRRFLAISAAIAYNTSKVESTSVLVVFSLIPLAPFYWTSFISRTERNSMQKGEGHAETLESSPVLAGQQVAPALNRRLTWMMALACGLTVANI